MRSVFWMIATELWLAASEPAELLPDFFSSFATWASFPCVRYRFPCDLENYIVDRASFLCVLYRFPRCWKNSTTDRTNFLCLRRFGHLNLGRSSSEENFCWKNIDMRFRSFSHISIWKACLEFQDYSRTFLRRRAEIDSSFFIFFWRKKDKLQIGFIVL